MTSCRARAGAAPPPRSAQARSACPQPAAGRRTERSLLHNSMSAARCTGSASVAQRAGVTRLLVAIRTFGGNLGRDAVNSVKVQSGVTVNSKTCCTAARHAAHPHACAAPPKQPPAKPSHDNALACGVLFPGPSPQAAKVGTCSRASISRPVPPSPGSGCSDAGASACTALRCAAPCAPHPAALTTLLLLLASAPWHTQGRAVASAAGAPAPAVPRAGPPLPWQLQHAAACPGGGRRQASSSRSTAARCAAFPGSSKNATAQNAPGTCRTGWITGLLIRVQMRYEAEEDRTAVLLSSELNATSGHSVAVRGQLTQA